MSAHVELFDQANRVLWLTHDGRGDELEANLRGYCLSYIPGLRHGRVGITYAPNFIDEARRQVLAENTEIVIDLLTARRGISQKEEDRFATALIVVQRFQASCLEAVS